MRLFSVCALLLTGCSGAARERPAVSVESPAPASPPHSAPVRRVDPPRAASRVVLLMLDASASMRAVVDHVSIPSVSPPRRPTRFDVARHFAAELVRQSQGDRIGVIVFAREAYVLVPPTEDKDALTSRIARFEFNQIDPNATAVGAAVLTAGSVLRRRDEAEKLVLIVSDADPGNEGTPVADAAATVASMSVKLVTVQLGESGEAEVQSGVDLYNTPLFTRHKFGADADLYRRIASQHNGRHLTIVDDASLAATIRLALDR